MDDPSGFDWALVRSFLAVLDAGSLSGAARAVGTAQPTLSRHVAELERQLGVLLFERTGRGLAPTAAARSIAAAARGMHERAGQLAKALVAQRDEATGSVRVTASEVASAHLLPPIIAELADAAPGIAVELVASNRVENLLRRDADVAVRMVRPRQRTLLVRKLGEVPIVACAHQRYLARAKPPRSIAELAAHRLVGYDRDDTILRGFARFGAPLARESFAVRTDHQVAYAHLVAAGAGIGFLARYSLAYLPGVVEVLPGLAIPPLPCYLAVHREIRGRAVVRRVFDELAARVSARLRGGG